MEYKLDKLQLKNFREMHDRKSDMIGIVEEMMSDINR